MASADDEIEKLLREVDGVLAGGSGAGGAQPARTQPGAAVDRRDSGFLEAAVPRAATIGVVWGAGMGAAFFVLPFLQTFSGAVAGFVTGFSVSLLGRWRRR